MWFTIYEILRGRLLLLRKREIQNILNKKVVVLTYAGVLMDGKYKKGF